MLKEKDKKYLEDEFKKNLKSPVKLYIFTSDDNCQYCEQTVQIAEELEETSDLIEMEHLDLDSELAGKW
ncbi:MAG: glutaredoxin, partial [Thermoplasmatales archaeon]